MPPPPALVPLPADGPVGGVGRRLDPEIGRRNGRDRGKASSQNRHTLICIEMPERQHHRKGNCSVTGQNCDETGQRTNRLHSGVVVLMSVQICCRTLVVEHRLITHFSIVTRQVALRIQKLAQPCEAAPGEGQEGRNQELQLGIILHSAIETSITRTPLLLSHSKHARPRKRKSRPKIVEKTVATIRTHAPRQLQCRGACVRGGLRLPRRPRTRFCRRRSRIRDPR